MIQTNRVFIVFNTSGRLGLGLGESAHVAIARLDIVRRALYGRGALGSGSGRFGTQQHVPSPVAFVT